jgi:hypothetical protein
MISSGCRQFARLDSKFFPALAGCFRGPIFREILSRGCSTYLRAAFSEAGVINALGPDAAVEDGLFLAFNNLRHYYRSDYVYRAAIASKLFLGRHSPNSTTLLPELRVDNCKADLVMLNGTSAVYEIKTERDKTDRLSSQLDAYLRMFDKIYVVTDEKHLHSVQQIAPNKVGILLLTPQFTIREFRPAMSNLLNVDCGVIFDTFRKEEWIEATRLQCGKIPDVRPLDLFDACRDLFTRVRPNNAHDMMVKLLKRRRQIRKVDFAEIPDYLAAAFVESAVPPKDWGKLRQQISSISLVDLENARS